MKIEKLTENKIRVIMKSDEIDLKNVNFNTIISKALETEGLFFDILQKAEKEVNFHTEGCKLLIEAFSSLDDILVLTITKYSVDQEKESTQQTKPKKLVVRRKTLPKVSTNLVCIFKDFNIFCEFCNFMKSSSNSNMKKIAKSSSLHLLHNTYYLLLKNINPNHEKLDLLFSGLSEFGEFTSFSNNFEAKLLEHGQVIIKKNAIDVGIQFL